MIHIKEYIGNNLYSASYSKSKEGSGMCRKLQLLGAVLLSVGIGVLLGGMLDSGFSVVILGISIIAAGCLILNKR